MLDRHREMAVKSRFGTFVYAQETFNQISPAPLDVLILDPTKIPYGDGVEAPPPGQEVLVSMRIWQSLFFLGLSGFCRTHTHLLNMDFTFVRLPIFWRKACNMDSAGIKTASTLLDDLTRDELTVGCRKLSL